MSLRGYRVYAIPKGSDSLYKIIVESVNNNAYLYIENGCITTLCMSLFLVFSIMLTL